MAERDDPRPSGGVPDALPLPLTRLIGREREVARVVELLGAARLLTLTGSGGVGKTRLALAVARATADRHPDGVAWVDLAPLADSALVAPAVAAAFGIRDAPGQAPRDALLAGLAGRRALAVVDNAEHLVDAVARLVEALLQGCPGLTALATSREPLGLAGEVTWRVPSLAAPDPAAPTDPARLDELAAVPAVALFLDRTRAALPDFALTERNATAVAEICARLDGIPLALELAAARVAALGVEPLAARLDGRFRLLTGGHRTALPRQQTLRATVDWSYALLTAAERALFDRLSVFAGGFALSAAEAVGAGGGIEAGAVAALLARLVEKSLVQAEAGADAAERYRLLETLRQYGRERLEAGGGAGAVRARHAAYYTAEAEAAERRLLGPDQLAELARLGRELDNLRAALQWAEEAGAAELGLRLAGALWFFWYQRTSITETRRWLTPLLDRSPSPTAGRARALMAAGIMAYLQRDLALARAYLEESAAIWRRHGEPWRLAHALNFLGLVVNEQGEAARARALSEESLALFSAAQDRAGMAWAYAHLGHVARDQGDPATAGRLYDRALALAREARERWNIAHALARLGQLAHGRGDWAAARASYEEALAVWRELGSRLGEANVLSQHLGELARATGDLAEARRCHEAGLTLYRVLGERRRLAKAAGWAAAAAAAQGDAAGARALYRECLAVQRELEDHEGMAAVLDDLAALVARRGRPGPADRLRAAAAALRGGAATSPEDQPPTPEQAVDGALPVTQLATVGERAAPLSEREAEVAALIARGLTNRQIAEKLSVSERTVDRHVSNILDKLGLGSRTQVAAWVGARRG
jgi:non-specific serine/threonine protein kinase